MKILFINSVCTRNGSTLMLLYFLEWLKKEHPEYQIDVISKNGGSLASDFDSVSKNHYKLFEKKSLFYRIVRSLLRKINVIQLFENSLYDYEIKRLKNNKYDLIYNNTIFNLELGTLLKKECNIPKMILHIHELQNFILSVHPRFEQFSPSIDLFICASGAVENNLRNNWGVINTTVIYSFTKLNPGILQKDFPKNAVIISGSGRGAERKGLDLFIQVCAVVSEKEKGREFKFQWLGYLTNEELSVHMKLVKELGLFSSFQFLEERTDTSEFYKETDIFLMSSREDPFPLVCIEAGSYGIPIFVFEGATGTQEIIGDLKHLISPQFDSEKMASNIVTLVQDQELYLKTSKLMNERFEKFDIETQSEELFKILSSYA